jgi:ribosomal 50S subunit-recycling heat shock protein
MRLDKYLKVSRLIKRRTVAKEACDAGKICVNGKQARASYELKLGDKIDLNFGGKTTSLEVTKLAETVRKEEADTMYIQK